VQKLTAGDPEENARFGRSVAIRGDTIVVGAHLDDLAGAHSNAGAVYVFDRNKHGQWIQVQKLTEKDVEIGANFGVSVAISGDTIAVGAHKDNDNGTDAGSAYIFRRERKSDGDEWNQVQKLNPRAASAQERFGIGVAIGGSALIVRAGSGSAYVFEA
jgi:hypothetical protein